MKKILTGILLFVLIIFLQLLYIDYRLNNKLDKISEKQFVLIKEVETLGIKTTLMTIKLEKTLLKKSKKPRSGLPALVSSGDFSQPDYFGSFPLAAKE